MTTESNLQSPEGVRAYRGRTLEEILPQIREELGPDAIILREREGLVGGVGGFFAQRFVEVEARRGDEVDASRGDDFEARRGSGSSIDIYDEEDELGFAAPVEAGLGDAGAADAGAADAGAADAGAGDAGAGDAGAGDAGAGDTGAGADEQALLPPGERSEPRPFVPPEVRRERIIPRDPQGEPAPPTRRFETDVFLERLRAASQMLPEEPPEVLLDESVDLGEPSAAAPEMTSDAPITEPPAPRERRSRPAPRTDSKPPPRTKAKPAPRTKAKPKPAPASRTKAEAPEQETVQPALEADPWTAAMAALVAETEPETSTPPPPSPEAATTPTHADAPHPAAPPATAQARPTPRPTHARPSQPSRNPYEDVRQRPTSLRAGLPTESPAGAGTPGAAGTAPRPSAPIPVPGLVAPLEIRGRDGGLRGVLSRLFSGRFGGSALPKPSPPQPLDAAAAAAIATKLTARGASQAWTAQLINTAGAHGTALAGTLLAAAEAELARRIVPAPSLPATGAAVAFIGAGGTGKTRCSAALAGAYSRASTLGVTVIAVDNPEGARELERLLDGDGVPVLSLSGERARQAVAAYRQGGFVIVDTPTATPTDPAAVEALGASLAPLELDATFVTLPATLGPQAARRALASFGRLNPSAVAITHADETDQLAVVVEIAIAHRIPLAYLHAGTDHRSALSSVDAATLAQQLLDT